MVPSLAELLVVQLSRRHRPLTSPALIALNSTNAAMVILEPVSRLPNVIFELPNDNLGGPLYFLMPFYICSRINYPP